MTGRLSFLISRLPPFLPSLWLFVERVAPFPAVLSAPGIVALAAGDQFYHRCTVGLSEWGLLLFALPVWHLVSGWPPVCSPPFPPPCSRSSERSGAGEEVVGVGWGLGGLVDAV